jgi:hypothetical protein
MPAQEFSENSKEDLEKIKEWLAKQPHLPQNIGKQNHPLLSQLRNTFSR